LLVLLIGFAGLATAYTTARVCLAEPAERLAAIGDALRARERAEAAELARFKAVSADLAGSLGQATGKADPRTTTHRETERLRAWIVARVNALRGVLAGSGVDVDRLIERADGRLSEGQGGPLLPVPERAAATPAAVGGTLDEDLSRLLALRRVLTAAPLAAPMMQYRLTSPFGVRRDPLTRRAAAHEGLDFGGAADARVLATAPGRVIEAGRAGAYGIMVEIDHGMGMRTRYAHLRRALVRPGDRVARRTPIGIMGNTGRSTGPHLHYEVRLDGRPLDPMGFLEAGRRLGRALQG
jgi:murein DD-endopeptidase MepM/ murein hydrolase activator NlpD